jgi:NRAMP (natural resistance-associated macrophage protein)-like metal ion transporter
LNSFIKKSHHKHVHSLRTLGPGLITGAADDDPSGIATYSQAGAQFGPNLLWSMVLMYPLMVGIQIVSARIGIVTGKGLAENIRDMFPRWLCLSLVLLLLIANTINIAADIAAMGAALRLVVGGGAHGHAIFFAVTSLILQVLVPYKRYVRVLKWLTLSLLAYVAVVFMVQVPWQEVFIRTVFPHITFSAEYITLLVALFGTTISPYLFFWQASQEVEDIKGDDERNPLLQAPQNARREMRRIRFDTYVGMGFSNLVAFFIILSTAMTLNAAGVTNIQTSAQAAEALRPLAGEVTFLLFSLGIIGTGMLAVPVLAGSAAYAVAECFHWPEGLDQKARAAKRFYGIIALATLGGVVLDFTSIDPVQALIWSAVINGVIAIPIMAVMMIMASRPEIMGAFTIKKKLRILGWSATGLMLITVITMFAIW